MKNQKVFKTFNAWEYYFGAIFKVVNLKIYKKNFLFSKKGKLKNFVNRLDTDKTIISLFRKLKFKITL